MINLLPIKDFGRAINVVALFFGHAKKCRSADLNLKMGVNSQRYRSTYSYP